MAYDQKSVVSLEDTSVFRPAWDAQECHEEEKERERAKKEKEEKRI